MADQDNSPENTENLPEATTAKKAELMERFFDNQELELETKREELELQKQEQEYTFRYARGALAASTQDRKEEREFSKGLLSKAFRFGTIIIIALILFFSYALYLGKEDIVKEIIKAILYISVSGAGGWAIGKRQSNGTESESDED